MSLFLIIAQIGLQLLKIFLDPKRSRAQELKEKEIEREDFQNALADGDHLVIAEHLSRLLKQAKDANYARRSNNKSSKS